MDLSGAAGGKSKRVVRVCLVLVLFHLVVSLKLVANF